MPALCHFRYLVPCNHMMLSQRWAVKERDCYSVSAAKLLALTPVCCASGITLTLGNQERDYILWSKCMHDGSGGNTLRMIFKHDAISISSDKMCLFG